MSITELYPPEQFYRSVDASQIVTGQFCWAVVPNPDPIPRILDIERYTPQEHGLVKFELRNARGDDFRSRDRVLPIKNLNLHSNEELLAQRAKKRPAIVLALDVDVFPEIEKILRQKGKKHCQEDSIFLIPCYDIENEFDRSGFPIEMVKRIKCLIFRQFFYLPDGPKFNEGIARFDRIQVISNRNQRITFEPVDMALSDLILGVFLYSFLFCISGIEDGELHSLRQLTKEAYERSLATHS